VVSDLGILAISWIALKERVTEIGTRRALGASQSDIVVQFLFEALIVGAAGGVAGLIVGSQVWRLVAERVRLPFLVDWSVARLALALSIGLNLLFSLVPATKAARLDPIDALQQQ
jgi:putative ABC transport system permease protein